MDVNPPRAWAVDSESIPDGQKLRLRDGTEPMTFRELFHLLESDREFASWYTKLLADADFDAFFWEHPPLTDDTWDDNAEFVLIGSGSLAALRPDSSPFARQFEAQPGDVISFPNLGGDALLVVPRQIGPPDAYPHLATFVRNAPEEQVLSLWRETASATRGIVGTQPRWLSTAGLGVSWLHLRLDTRPKYYRHDSYRA